MSIKITKNKYKLYTVEFRIPTASGVQIDIKQYTKNEFLLLQKAIRIFKTQ